MPCSKCGRPLFIFEIAKSLCAPCFGWPDYLTKLFWPETVPQWQLRRKRKP